MPSVGEEWIDTEAGLLTGIPVSITYIQESVGSRNSAIRNAYHNSLRPSSLFEPRHRSLKGMIEKDSDSLSFIIWDNMAVHTCIKRTRYGTCREMPIPCSFRVIHESIDFVSAVMNTSHIEYTRQVVSYVCEWSFRRFTYGNLVTTSPSSKW